MNIKLYVTFVGMILIMPYANAAVTCTRKESCSNTATIAIDKCPMPTKACFDAPGLGLPNNELVIPYCAYGTSDAVAIQHPLYVESCSNLGGADYFPIPITRTDYYPVTTGYVASNYVICTGSGCTGVCNSDTRTCYCSGSSCSQYTGTYVSCAAGYYGHATDSYTGCQRCPPINSVNNNQIYGTTIEDIHSGISSITDCFVDSDTLFRDDIGTFFFSDVCQYSVE